MIASGPEGGQPVVLLHATGMSSTVWFPNAGDLGRPLVRLIDRMTLRLLAAKFRRSAPVAVSDRT